MRLDYAYVDGLIGKKIGNETIKSILKSLDIEINKEDAEGLDITVPAFRVDVQRPCDVVEEVLRIYGKAYPENLRGEVLTLKAGAGQYHAESGVWGIPVMPGKADTGFISLGGDLFYVAESGKENDLQYGYATLMRLNRSDWTFSRVE